MRDVFDNMLEAVTLLDHDFRLVAVNRRGLEMDGRPLADLIGRPWWEVWPTALVEPVEAILRDCRARQVPVTVENCWRRDGGDRTLHLRAVPVDGGIAVFCDDVTSRRQLEARHNATKDLLRSQAGQLLLTEQEGRVGTWDWDIAGGGLAWSAGIRSLAGLPPDTPASDETFYHLVHPDDRDRLNRYIDAVVAGSELIYQVDFRIRRADTGEVRWLAGHGRITRDEAGRPLHLRGVNLDITERRQAELERETILRSIDEGFVVLDDQWRFLYINPAAERIFGCPKAELLGVNHWDAFPMSRGTAVEDAYRRTMAGTAASFENFGPGLQRWFEVRAYPGLAGGITIHFRDITERKATQLALAESEERFRSIVQDQTELICRFRSDGTLLFVNPAHAAAFGRTAEALLGTSFYERMPPDERAPVRAVLEGLSPGQSSPPHTRRVTMPDGSLRWQEWCTRRLSPDLYQAVGRDVTETKQTEDRLRGGEARLRLALRAGGLVPWEAERQGGGVTAGPELGLLYGLAPGADPTHIGSYVACVDPDDRELYIETFAAVDRPGRTARLEYKVRRASDGAVRSLFSVAEGAEGEDGRLRLFGFCTDITDQRRAEEANTLLMREVDHRAKNVMAVIQGLVNLTRADTIAGFKAAVAGRVEAMARAHALLAQSRWHGGALGDIVAQELAPFGDRCRWEGPKVMLPASMVQPIALALHELATNAVKYGALSVPLGRVRVRWRRAGGPRVVLDWQESGGPAVVPPRHEGFGSLLLTTGIESQAGGSVEMEWHPAGLRCHIALTVAGSGDDDPSEPPPELIALPVDGPILIVEDQPLIAMQLEAMLADIGLDAIDSAAQLSEAMQALEGRRYGMVMLDADLQGQSTQPLALELESRGIPYVWCTGYEEVPGGSRGAPILSKPYDERQVAALLNAPKAGA